MRRTGVVIACAAVGLLNLMPSPVGAFPNIPDPKDSPPMPREPGQVLPDARVSGTASWAFRSNTLLLARHGSEEADRLVRMSAALEELVERRKSLFSARTEFHKQMRRANKLYGEALEALPESQAEPWRSRDLRASYDLLAKVAGVWPKAERDVTKAWRKTLGQEDSANWSLRTRELLSLVKQTDQTEALVLATADSLISEQRQLFEQAKPVNAAKLEVALEAVDSARAKLREREQTWRESSAPLWELETGFGRMRALMAAARSDELASWLSEIRADESERAQSLLRVLSANVESLREYAANRHPTLISVHSTFLDLSRAAPDGDRRTSSEALTRILDEQIPLLGDLYQAREKRERAYARLKTEESTPLLEDLRQASAWSWRRLSLAAKLLEDPKQSAASRGWAWTEVGSLRDELISVEKTLAEGELDTAYRTGAKAPNEKQLAGLLEPVREQTDLIAKLQASQAAEQDALRALAAASEPIQAEATQRLRSWRDRARALQASAAGERQRDALITLAAVLEQRLQHIERELEFGTALGKAAERQSKDPLITPSYREAARALRALPDFEGWIDADEPVLAALERLATATDATPIDVALMDVAQVAGVFPEPRRRASSIELRYGPPQASYVVAWASPSAQRVPGLQIVPARWDSRVGASSILLVRQEPASGEPTTPPPPFWERGSQFPPEWERGAGERLADGGKALGSEFVNSWPSYLAAGGLYLVSPYFPPAGVLATTIAGGTATKDAVIGGTKAVSEVALSDPRTRGKIRDGLGWARKAWEVAEMKGNWARGGSTEAIDAAITAGGWFAPGINMPDISYEERVARADTNLLRASYLIEACKWAEAQKELIQAAIYDPYKQSAAWDPQGNAAMKLAYEGVEKGPAAAESLRVALETLAQSVRKCDPALTLAELDKIPPLFAEDVKWTCDETFVNMVNGTRGDVIDMQAGILAYQDTKYAFETCEAAQVLLFADRVAAWTGPERYDCSTEKMADAKRMRDLMEPRVGLDVNQIFADIDAVLDFCGLEDADGLLKTLPEPVEHCEAKEQLTARRKAVENRLAKERQFAADLKAFVGDAETANTACKLVDLQTAIQGIEALGESECSEEKDEVTRLKEMETALDEKRQAALKLLTDAERDLTPAWQACDTDRIHELGDQARDIAKCGREMLNDEEVTRIDALVDRDQDASKIEGHQTKIQTKIPAKLLTGGGYVHSEEYGESIGLSCAKFQEGARIRVNEAEQLLQEARSEAGQSTAMMSVAKACYGGFEEDIEKLREIIPDLCDRPKASVSVSPVSPGAQPGGL